MGASIETPVEITIFEDIVLHEPIIIEENVHIRLVPGNKDVTITRGSDNLDFPLIWVQGENSSLTLGKPGMQYELIFDGGYLNNPSITANAPIASVSGPYSKLIMYDKVILQNNHNNGPPESDLLYQTGSGVNIRTDEATDVYNQAEFIMKGGIIRGNINEVQRANFAAGAAVWMSGFGLFTMEGGAIMGNTARFTAGGVGLGSRSSFIKTGGIIYGKDAPEGYRNIAVMGDGEQTPKYYGHAVRAAVVDPVFIWRDDTVGENDNLSYIGVPTGPGTIGQGDKWRTHNDIIRERWMIVIASALAFVALVIVIARIIVRKHIAKQKVIVESALAKSAPLVLEPDAELSDREREIFNLLLTELSVKEIAGNQQLTYSGANFHIQKVYSKLGVQSRPELFAKYLKK